MTHYSKCLQLIVFTAFLLIEISRCYSQNSVWTWGDNNYGQLGNGTFLTSGVGVATPTHVNSLNDVVATTCGTYHSVALQSNGTVWGWGRNNYGQIGNGTFYGNAGTYNDSVSTPTQVLGLSNIMAISSLGSHTLALKNDGTVWAWGNNYAGQLGNGTYNASTPTGNPTPAQVIGLSNVVAIAAGSMHSLALKNDGTVWSWGWNAAGQLGNGTLTGWPNYGIANATQISGLTNIISIACGGECSFAIQSNGFVWAWGDNIHGELGLGFISSTNSPSVMSPTQVAGLTNIVAIIGSRWHNLALKNDQTVWSWGYNNNGQLGNGTYNNSNAVPIQINGLTNATSVAGGNEFSIACKNDGSVWTWGSNEAQALGNNSPNRILTPTQVNGIANVLKVSAGYSHSLVLAAPQPINFTGKVKLQRWAGPNLSTAYVTVDAGVQQQISLNNNLFNVIVNPGYHTIRVRVDGFLSQRLAVQAAAGNIVNFYGQNGNGLLAGDTNNDNVINDNDLLSVINNFLSSGPEGDTNGDGIVDDYDLLTVINNFLDVGDV